MLGHAQKKHPFEVAISRPKRLGEFDGARLTNGINDCLEGNGAEADAIVVEIFVRYELVGVSSGGRPGPEGTNRQKTELERAKAIVEWSRRSPDWLRRRYSSP